MKVTVESDIARPPSEVFDRMADARNEPSWNSQVSRSELVSEEPIGEGSTPRGEGSHVVSEYHFRPKGAMKVMFPVMTSAIRKDLAKKSQSFKRFCERS